MPVVLRVARQPDVEDLFSRHGCSVEDVRVVRFKAKVLPDKRMQESWEGWVYTPTLGQIESSDDDSGLAHQFESGARLFG